MAAQTASAQSLLDSAHDKGAAMPALPREVRRCHYSALFP